MANLTETANWETGIYQIETTDLVLGGPAGVANLQPKQLANRTAWLKQQVESLGTANIDWSRIINEPTTLAGYGITDAVPASRAVNTTAPLTGGGALNADRTLGIQDATTAQKGAVQLTDSVSSTSTTTAAVPNSVKAAYDLANTANTTASSAASAASAANDNANSRLLGGASMVVGCITLGRIDYSLHPSVSIGDNASAMGVYCDGIPGNPTGTWIVLGVYQNTDNDFTVLIQRTA
jgi:phage-related tail fiber protein